MSGFVNGAEMPGQRTSCVVSRTDDLSLVKPGAAAAAGGGGAGGEFLRCAAARRNRVVGCQVGYYYGMASSCSE